MNRKLIVLLLFFIVLPAFSWALESGEKLPPLTGRTLQGEAINLSQLDGQPILLKVGTTWCPTCGQQTAQINRIRPYLKENNIQYVEVFVQETPRSVRRYFKQSGQPLPDVVILDKGTIARALNLYLIPRLILVDKNFTVVRDGDPLMAEQIKQLTEQL